MRLNQGCEPCKPAIAAKVALGVSRRQAADSSRGISSGPFSFQVAKGWCIGKSI
jgi:hypothetical protein